MIGLLLVGFCLSQLPWEGGQQATAVTSSLELLERYGFGPEQLAHFEDGRPFSEAENRVLLRLLFRLPRIPAGDLAARARSEWQAEDLALHPAADRCSVFRVTGRARSVTEITVPEDEELHFEFDRYYRVELASAAGSPELVILTRAVPVLWKRAVRLDEPAVVRGVFVKNEGAGSTSRLVFAASRIEWFPDRATERRATSNQVWLATHGMDIALFDDVRQRNRKPVAAADRECFYRLLATVESVSQEQFAERARRPLELGPLLQEPALHHGEVCLVHGTVRRITTVEVTDLAIQQRLGIHRYYQLDIFVPLGDQVIQFTSRDASKAPKFSNSYPVTVCAGELPAGLEPGEELNRAVSLPAVFFKLWAYRSRYVSSFDEHQLQLSPMLIGASLRLISPPSDAPSQLPLLWGCSFLVVLAVVWFFIWRTGRGDKESARRRRKLLEEPSS